jgi:signal transduction histidine kinase
MCSSRAVSRIVIATVALICHGEALGGPASVKCYRVGVNRSAKSYFDDQGRLTGLYVEVFRVAAQRAGLSYEFVWLDKQSLDRAFAENRIDLHVAVADTQLRRKSRMYMAEPWWESPLIVILPRTSSYKRAEELKGATVAVMRAAEGFWDLFFEPSLPGSRRLDVPPPENAIDWMCTGKVAAVLTVGPDAEAMLANHPPACRDIGFRFLRVPIQKAKYSLASQPELRPVCDRLNTEIREMAIDGALSATVSPFLGLNSAASDSLTQAVAAERRLTVSRAVWAIASGSLVLLLLCVLLWRERRVRRRVADALDRARRGDEVKSQFLAMMSHEVRTPINGILGMAELMLTTPLDDEQREAAITISRSSEALVCVLNDVLDLSQLEAGRVAVVQERFLLRPMLDDIVRLLTARVREKHLSLYLDIASGAPDSLVGDPGRLRQILLNLAGNAVKFTDSGFVELSVTSAAPGEVRAAADVQLRFAVRDSGPGIPPGKLPLLFKKFTQLDSTPGRRYGGAGLGLAISKGLVEAMGGRIEMKSEWGKGCTVWFSMPFGSGGEDPKPLAGRRVCFVGSDAEQVRRLGQLATAAGAVLTAGQPDVVVEIAQNGDLNIRGIQQAEAPIARNLLTGPILSSALLDALAPPQATVPAMSLPPDRFTGKRILVAEDNAVNRKVLNALLRKHSCEVLEAHNGEQAVAIWRATRPDLVLMDCQMPILDGYEATRIIRADESGDPSRRRCPIWAVTAGVMAEDQARCLASGMDDIMSKPFTLARLTRTLTEALEAPSPNTNPPRPDSIVTS